MITYRSISLAAFDDNINHAFFSRNGGIGTGLYNNLNVSLLSDDNPDVLAENRKRCAEHIGVEPERLVTLAQCHSDVVLTITDTQNLPHQAAADALVTYLRMLPWEFRLPTAPCTFLRPCITYYRCNPRRMAGCAERHPYPHC